MSESENTVYVVYFKDDTMFNYYPDKNEANSVAASLNKESTINGAIVKEEPITNFERKN